MRVLGSPGEGESWGVLGRGSPWEGESWTGGVESWGEGVRES